jgi:hypothetical protein
MPECRKASKAASQKRWLQNEESQDYFRGPLNVQRVQEWRKSHPGYWRRKPSENKEPALSAAEPAEPRKAAFASLEGKPLQDLLIEKPMEYPVVAQPLPYDALQDLLSSQLAVLIGLIAHVSGTALQDDIVLAACHLQQLGNAILNPSAQGKGDTDDRKTPHPSTAYPKAPRPVQLGGSAAGP